MTAGLRAGLALLVPVASGLLFGGGLALGGLTNPARVRGFLDVFGAWDPTLAFVMFGAVVVMAVAWRIKTGLHKPLAAARFLVSDRKDITPHLIGGAAIFGVGWGIAGLCPGPAIASIVTNPAGAAVFVVAMTLGMLAARLFEEK